jgi:ankyrin repeat protein
VELTFLQNFSKTHDSSVPISPPGPLQSTPLHEAVKQGNETIVRLLVEHHANIHALNVYGQTPLHLAVVNDQRSIICYLLDVGSNLNTPDSMGRMPLETAIVSGNEQLVRLLLSKGADVNLSWIDHSSPEQSNS